MGVWVLLVNDGEEGRVEGVYASPELAYDKFQSAVGYAGVPTDAKTYDGSHLIVRIGRYDTVELKCWDVESQAAIEA